MRDIEYVNWEQNFKNILKYQGYQGKKIVKEQLKLWTTIKNCLFKEINNYYILDIKKIYTEKGNHEDEFLVIRKDFEIFKSFRKSNDAIDYCLDKINTENKQLSIF